MVRPGEIIPGEGDIECNPGREAVTLRVENTSRYHIFVCSHYHFFEASRHLRFDRRLAYGRRLDIPAGTSVHWAPGEVKEVRLIDLAGHRRVLGFHGLVNGYLSPGQMEEALARARLRGFQDSGVQ